MSRSPSRLTPRELNVLALKGYGASHSEIAAALDITVKTVETHLGRISWKANARGQAALTALAIHSGLLEADDLLTGSSTPWEDAILPQTPCGDVIDLDECSDGS